MSRGVDSCFIQSGVYRRRHIGGSRGTDQSPVPNDWRGGQVFQYSQTPYKYLPPSDQAFPINREDVGHITEADVAVHCEEAPKSSGALAWYRLRGSWSAGPVPVYLTRQTTCDIFRSVSS